MRSIELFAGIGGIALAAEWAGIETVAFCEREPFPQKVLNKHWPNVPIFDDVRTLNKQALEERGIDVGTIGLISGGFPCQPYSIAGKRRGKEDDRDLWPEMFRIIKEIRPRWVVGENVANFVNMELDRTLFDLESIGYAGKSFVIPACAVNAKHRRERTFVVAYSRHSKSQGWNEIEERQQHSKRRKARSELASCGNNVANTNNSGCIHRQNEKQSAKTREHAQREPISSGQNVAHTYSESGLQTSQAVSAERSEWYSRNNVSGSSRGCQSGNDWWAVEPDVGRVANGVPDRVDRLKSLGNAVVPQQIYPIFKYIMEIERMNNQ